jgi:hypothetical protein
MYRFVVFKQGENYYVYGCKDGQQGALVTRKIVTETHHCPPWELTYVSACRYTSGTVAKKYGKLWLLSGGGLA